MPVKAFVVAGLLVVIDYILVHGPGKNVILRHFGQRSITEKEQVAAYRLCGQVSARIIGVFFLLFMFPYAIHILMDPGMGHDTLYSHSTESAWCMALTAGYFLYDLYICLLRFSQNGTAFLIHAVVCCLAYLYPVVSGHLHYMGAAYLMWEVSTPFLYLRWYLLKSGQAGGKFMIVANMLFAAAFLGCRILYGPYMSWQFWSASGKDLAAPSRDGAIPHAILYSYRTAMFILNGLNYFWFSQIVKVAFAKDPGAQRRKEV